MRNAAAVAIADPEVVDPYAQLAPIAKDTVQGQVYAALRAAIMRGELKPGQNLTIPGLAQSLGTSAMPVRQALYRLAAERAVTVVSGRSVGVPPLSRARLKDLTRVRLEVEGMAVEWAAKNVSRALLAQVTDLVEQMWRHSEAAEAGEFLGRNQRFHFAIYEAAGSPALIPIIESLWLQIGPYLSLLHRSKKYRAANGHHAALCKALARGDKKGARRALESDIVGAADVLLTLVADD
jgi:DNA-binding GntR family transcriptional regulator